MHFSVLMSIYHKEKPSNFDRAMLSIWDEQSVKPSEIILVEDGVLPLKLNTVILFWIKKLDGKLKIIKLEENVGLGRALNIGLSHCSYELVARMDTDDISAKDRFKKQLAVFESKDVDICSAWVSEFDTDENKLTFSRKVPQEHEDIVTFSKKRCPVNHPVVMYKKSMVQKAANYKHMLWFEDYYLWARMIQEGAVFYNIQEPLLSMRAGEGQMKRRQGVAYGIAEYRLMHALWDMGFLNRYEFIRNIIMRFTARLLPKNFLKRVYIIFLRS